MTATVVVRGDDVGWRVSASAIGLHLLGLIVFLLLAWFVIRPEVTYFSDEGAAAAQATQLARGEGWTYVPPFRDLDPEGSARPFLRGVGTEGGVAPYAKHPVYPLVLAGVRLLVGQIGFVLLSVFGTVVAAAGAALLASRWGSTQAVAALWLTGAASPLLFDSFLIVAHTLAAAAVVWAVLGLVLSADAATPARSRGLLACLVAAGVMASVWLRTESILFWSAALTVGAAIAIADREVRRRVVPLIVVVAASVVAARFAEVVAVRAIVDGVGGALPDTAPALADRLSAAWTTLVAPSRSGRAVGDLLLLLGSVAVIVACVGWQVGRRRVLELGMLVAVLLTVVAGVTRTPGAVPGLFVVTPWAVAGLVLLVAHRRRPPRLVTALVATLGLFFGAVLVTQYSQGGGVEWGWRYVALALPLIAVVSVQVLAVALEADPWARRPVVGGLAVLSIVFAVMAIAEAQRGHQASSDVLAAVDGAALQVLDDGARPGRPVVLGVGRLLPEILWPSVDAYDWLAVDAPDLSTYGDRLADSGATSMVLITPDPDRDLDALDGWEADRAQLAQRGRIWVVPVTRTMTDG